MAKKPESIDAYIAGFPGDVQAVLQKVRQTIREAVPEAQETIGYAIPTFTLNGAYLIYFAGYRQHVAVYPRPRGDSALIEALAPYGASNGTLRFPLDKPIPYDLIGRMARAMVPDAMERSLLPSRSESEIEAATRERER